MVVLFWLSVGLIFYVVVGYPLLLALLWRLKGSRKVAARAQARQVNFLVPAHNEEAVIGDKIRNTLALDNTDGHQIRVLVVSDGSTDATVEIARSFDDPRVEVVETPGRYGKLKAMNMAMEMLKGDIIVFSDANAMLAPETMTAMMRHFEDPGVGGVCGQITIAKKGQIAKADGVFWRYDQMMKHAESNLGGTVSAQGSIHALRRSLAEPVPPGVADDFVLSVRAVAKGYRLAFEPRATTTEAVTEAAGSEIGRRIRSTEMGWRALMLTREVMNPLRFGLYAWQIISHKFLRRLVPLFLLVMLISNLALLGQGPFWGVFALGQILFYAVALIAYLVPATRRLPLWGKIMFFVMSNVAMALGLIAYYRGRESSVWTPVRDTTA